jgi:hypothetical protein
VPTSVCGHGFPLWAGAAIFSFVKYKVLLFTFGVWGIGCNFWNDYNHIYSQIASDFKFTSGVVAFVVKCGKWVALQPVCMQFRFRHRQLIGHPFSLYSA